MKWTPDLLIALIIVVGCIALIANGIDGEVKVALGMAAGWAFRSARENRRVREGVKQ